MNRKVIHYTAQFVWLLLFGFCLSLQPVVPVLAQPAEAYAMAEAVNAYRESLGLPRLLLSDALMLAAQRHAEWMTATYTNSHIGEGGTTPQDRAVAAGFNGSVSENVGGSDTATPAEIIFFWDQSSGHQYTMRLAQATHIGAGFATNAQERQFVLLIGTATGQAPQPTTQPVAAGTPVIGYTPPAGMIWSANGEVHVSGELYTPITPLPGQPVAVANIFVASFDYITRAEPRADGSIVHIVEDGETAWAIALRYEVDLPAMLSFNQLPENPVLHAGDEIIICPAEGQPDTMPNTHQVQSGESLWTIAALHNRSVDDLLAWNNLPDNPILQPGEILLIAPPTLTPTATLLPATPLGIPSAVLDNTLSIPTVAQIAAVLSQPASDTATSLLTHTPQASTEAATLPRQNWLVGIVLLGLFAGLVIWQTVKWKASLRD